MLDATEPTRVLIAAAMAVAAMISLLIGASVGLFFRPSHKVNAIIMAFGTGALIQALAVELAFEGAERLVHQAHLNGVMSWLWVAGGFAAGGSIYYIGNRIIDQMGGALRHPALAKLFLLEKKREESAAVLSRLSKIDLVRSLPPEEMEDVLDCIEPVEVKAGEKVFRMGDVGDALYFIDDGQIDIVSTNGEETSVIARLETGQSFGEMALLTGEPRSGTAVAVKDTALLRIKKKNFDELMKNSPNLRRAVEELNSQRLLQNVEKTRGKIDAVHWQKVAVANIQRLTRNEELALMQKHVSAGAPLAIFLGAMLDGIPESIVIGSSFVSLATYQFTFLAAVFVSNLPEAMASAAGMKEAGFAQSRVFMLWGTLVVAGAIAAALGNMFLTEAPPTVLTLVEAIAGGGILAMVSSVMMPEAYEHGGPDVGLATIAGFLVAFLFKFV
ncbi:MAG TPA: cyclic nucleotide-binding domain-containing protein [Bacteroidota bacterium]|nr:cyclic nucleotide-binding domain-containing protein [Bacteroidota bacterium]